ncbi:type II toxin-antitoxin system RelE/ParE family toxin, partial [Thiopseudomonas denitrificans]|uniref:type II toxin-antitoxin system RelE/ParE family toxin n=1 Tax=Thiopseudomonas denitrificans TaxID=1501432 RepID=UPI003B8365D9
SSGGRDEFLLTSDTPRLLMPPDMAYLIAEVILSLFPYMHKLGRVAGTREAIVTANYFMVYRVTHCVEILEVLHTRREYP